MDYADVENNYDETIVQNEFIKEKQEALAQALCKYWDEVSVDATEGNECLAELTNELRKISANTASKVDTTPELDKLISVVGKLDASRKSSEMLNKALSDASPLIRWYPNNVYEDVSEAADLDNYCANIVGKERDSQSNPFLFYSENVIVGLFLLGPNRLYPEHAHPASELWVVLSGTAKWKRGSEPWQIRKSGEYFIHTPNHPHAMETMDEPLFALWAWTGDLEKWAQWVDSKDDN